MASSRNMQQFQLVISVYEMSIGARFEFCSPGYWVEIDVAANLIILNLPATILPNDSIQFHQQPGFPTIQYTLSVTGTEMRLPCT